MGRLLARSPVSLRLSVTLKRVHAKRKWIHYLLADGKMGRVRHSFILFLLGHRTSFIKYSQINELESQIYDDV